jgi:hypothetical protein
MAEGRIANEFMQTGALLSAIAGIAGQKRTPSDFFPVLKKRETSGSGKSWSHLKSLMKKEKPKCAEQQPSSLRSQPVS